MSPASQGGLEVKRYIGSCLISASALRKTGAGCGAAAAAATASGGGAASKVAVEGVGPRARADQQQQYGPLLPLCDCRAGYGSAGRGSWTGLPLISMATPRAASHRKPAAAERSAFSRLAMHTQGAPLILAGRYGGRKHGTGQRAPHGHPQARALKGGTEVSSGAPRRQTREAAASNTSTGTSGAPTTARRTETAADATSAADAGAGRTTSSDSLNTASDESSGPSENSLPRIIKPRKRRKKDRKPPASAPGRQQSPVPSTSEAPTPEGSNIVTLKPYVPLCYELYESLSAGNKTAASGRRLATREGGRRNLWDAERTKQRSAVSQVPLPRKKLLVPESEEAENAKIDLRRDRTEEKISAEESSELAYTPSLCQCRYCDPSGLIWDVHRHCYSPFLTPPGSQEPASTKSSFDNSPFASIPLFLSAPPNGDAADTDDGFFSEDLPTSPFSLFGDGEATDSDRSAANSLRRSWSGCSSSSQASGSSLSSSNSIASPTSGTRARVAAPISIVSQGLEVSTEIVTSPNGHRDIEIKFYSSSAPSSAVNGDLETGNAGTVNYEQQVRSQSSEAAWSRRRCESENVPGHTVWDSANRANDDGDGDSDGECAEKYLGESLWANIQAVDEHSAKALGEEVYQLRIQAEE